MPTPLTASVTMMTMVVLVVMLINRGAQINWCQITGATKFCTVSPNIYEFAIWPLFNATLLAFRILRSTLIFGGFANPGLLLLLLLLWF